MLVRAPTPFPTIWTIVSPLIDERTRLKVYLYSGSELTKNLNSYLANDAIPTFLGKFETETSFRHFIGDCFMLEKAETVI